MKFSVSARTVSRYACVTELQYSSLRRCCVDAHLDLIVWSEILSWHLGGGKIQQTPKRLKRSVYFFFYVLGKAIL